MEGKKNYSKPYKKKETSKVVYMPKRGKLAPLMSEEEKQIYRSGTSVGANVRESKHAQSDADFLSKMSIAYK
jgi:four helix bundle protein